MSNLIHSPKIPLSRGIVSDPFATLFAESVSAGSSLARKTQDIKDFCITLKDIEETTESVLTRNHWLSITSGFSAAAAVAGSAAMVPLAGVLVSGAAVVATVAAIADSYLTKSKIEPISETLTRHRIALESQKTIHWAALWEITGTELFCKAVSYSARGFLSEGKLVQQGQDSPFVRATDYAAESLGATYDAVIDAIDSTIAGRQTPQLQQHYTSSLHSVTQTLPPATPQQYSGSVEPVPTQQLVNSTPLAFERPPVAPQSFTEVVEFKQEVPDLPLRLAQDMKNTLIAGVPGSGKGVFVSNALGYVIERGDTTVFYIDPKNDPKESGYFEGRVHKLFRLPGGIISAEPVFVYDWLQKCFAAFHSFDAGNGRKLLVLDEMTSLVKKLANVPAKITGTVKGDKWLEEEIVTCAAAGDSAGATLWGMAQNGHNSGLGMDGGAKSQMTPIAIISLKQLTASQALLRASFVPSDQRLSSDEIKRICEASEVGRAIFHGGLNCWYSMPALPNPSGYNRDNRQFVEGFTAPVAVIQSQPVSQHQPVDTPSSNYSDEQRKAVEAAIVAALRTTNFHTLWEFGRDELGLQSSEEIKKLLEFIGEAIFDYDLTELKEKFRLRSKYDVRYSYAGYSKKVAATHRKTNNACALCHQNQSEEAHHIEYLGIEDEPGKNLLPLCLPCHKEIAHSRENWQQISIWKSRNTPEFEARLKLEYQFELVEGEAQ